jgi:hypothetical protein
MESTFKQLNTLGKKEKGREKICQLGFEKMLSKFTMSSLQVLYEIKILNGIFKDEWVYKYNSDDTIFFIRYFYNMSKWGFQMLYYHVLQSYYRGCFRLGSLVSQNCVA